MPAPSDDARRALDALPQLVWAAGPDGTMEYLSRRCGEYAGLAVDDLLAWDWRWVVHPDDLPGAMVQWASTVRSGVPSEFECRLRRRDGQYRWFLSRSEPVLGPGGAVVRWVGTCTDIEEMKRAEIGLRATAGLFHALVERGDLGFALLTPERLVRYASPSIGRLLGRPPGVFTGTDALDWAHPDDRARVAAALEEALGRPGERVGVSARLRRADGEHRAVRGWLLNLLPDPDVRAVAVTFWEADEPGAAPA